MLMQLYTVYFYIKFNHLKMREIIETNEYYNAKAIRSNRIFAGIIFYFQVAMIVLYAFFVIPTPSLPDLYSQDLLITIAVAILVLVGFGLILSIGKNKIWSSLGFNLLITAVTFQLYFLVSGFWTNVGISGANKSLTWGGKLPVFLSESYGLTTNTYGITAVQAFKCSLANIIAFAAISGRAGPLEAMIISLLGTVLYELNRQLVSRYSFDFGGTMTIFCFGGFFGSTISVVLYHCKQKEIFQDHKMRINGKFSMLLTGMGSLFCWVFFPFLNIDIPVSLILNYTAGINTVYCISACLVTTVSLCCMIYGRLDLKVMILSVVSGGVVAGSSVAMINDSLAALLLGIGAGIAHVVMFQLDQLIRWYIVVENYVFYLYAIMGACGGLASAIFANVSSRDNNFTSITAAGYVLPPYYNQFIGVGISVGIGLIAGLILSPLFCLINVETKDDYYHDRAYWIIEQDGISLMQNIQQSTENSSINEQEQQSVPETVFMKEILIKEPRSAVLDSYAYL